RSVSRLLAVSRKSHRLSLDRQPRMLMTRPRSRPVSWLLAVSRQSHRFPLSPQARLVMTRPRSRPVSRLLAVSCQSHRLPLDLQPRMLMTRPRSRPVSRLLAVSRQSHRFHLSPQFLLRLFSLSMQNYRMLPSLSDALFSFLVPPFPNSLPRGSPSPPLFPLFQVSPFSALFLRNNARIYVSYCSRFSALAFRRLSPLCLVHLRFIVS